MTRATEKPKFTPGEWNVRAGKAWIVETAGGRRVVSTADNRIRSQEEANARLIAAAPEMYEALRSMVAGFKPFTFRPVGAPGSPAREEQDEQNRAHAAARAALAKVEGRG